METLDTLLQQATIFRRLSLEDRQRLAESASVRTFAKTATIFREGESAGELFTVVSGRVKVFKTTPRGTDVILAILGPGDPLAAVAVYESKPYPASATALEPTACIVIPGHVLFELLERHPTMIRGLLSGLTVRMMELTNRLAELSGGRIEPRLARFFLKLAAEIGREGQGGTFLPLVLSRQELADLAGTTVETCIRIMSRWGKEGIVRTEKDGFTVLDRDRLQAAAID